MTTKLRRSLRARPARVTALAVGLVLAAAPMRAQQPGAGEGSDAHECLAFAFGRFVPALDMKAAGHTRMPSAAMVPRAPESRDWASRDSTHRGMSLMLYPAWWPVGVLVELPRARLGVDTLKGTATALVADGRVAPPVARILAWAVPCGRPNAAAGGPGSSREFPGAPRAPLRDSLSPRDSARGAPGAQRPSARPCVSCTPAASHRPR